jgi:hypothetical protein
MAMRLQSACEFWSGRAGIGTVADLREQQPRPEAAKPVIVEEMAKPIRHQALLIHTKGRLVSTSLTTLDAEYFDNGNGSGTSRLIFQAIKFGINDHNPQTHA